MSGGSHNYTFYKIEEEYVGRMHDRELDDMFNDIVKLCHDLEWYDSSDINIDDYHKTVKMFKEKWFGGSRNKRLKGYVDSAVDELREELHTLIGVDTCICCGKPVPEGRQVCWKCEKGEMHDKV